MGVLPFAFSVHHFISSVGADAGFAAIIGLAILVLLFFAQARETTTLRHHAEELMARIGELEARLARLASAQAAQAEETAAARAEVAAMPAAARSGALTAAAAGGSASLRLAELELPPFPPAGVAAPALTAATRVIPVGVAARAVATRVPVGVGATVVDGPPPPAGPVAPSAPETRPATAAGATNGTGHGSVAPAPYRGGAAGQRPPVSPRSGPAPGQAPRRAPAKAGTALPPHLAIKPERSRATRIALALLIVAVIAGAAVAVILLTQDKSTPAHTNAASSQSTAASRTPAATVVNPATVTVSVLNGTTTNGFAGKTANQLAVAGFRKGTVATANAQTNLKTVVYYLPGHETAGLAVARKLGLTAGAVRLIDQTTRNVAFNSCKTPPCTADVVVLLGADLAAR